MSNVLSITFGEGVTRDHILRALEGLEIPGTITGSFGYTPEWGTEASTTLTTTVGSKEERDTVETFVANLLEETGEEAAFVTTNGRLPQLWKRSDSAKLVIQGI